MFMQLFFLKFTQRVTIFQTASNQEVTLKRLIRMLQITPKLHVGALSDLCEMYKLFIQQCDQRDPSPLIGKLFCLFRKHFMQVRAFERYIPLKLSDFAYILLIDIKMPTDIGILTLISMINFMLS